MKPTRRFAQERHGGPYASWPIRTRVLADGAPTSAGIAGYTLPHQWQVPDGYLLVADHDCPSEEATTFALLSPDLRVLGMRTLSALYGSYLLQGVEWLGERRLVATFDGGFRYEVEMRERGIPFLRPRLRVRRIRG